ncbi:MAG: anti-sigma factor antagonist [Christensenellaceae bacterium]|nr:anti-sigma factor antagonist [Christensenellaceae bacterium]MDD6927538.1 anti-sigma factor antagonist [bacterium]MDY2850849.1 anti-sigma factor antagonist [Christensenellaceae bacterium]
MEIKFKNVRDRLYIYLYGELDEHTSCAVRGLIDDLIDRNLSMGGVVFNMANVSFMDSTGLGFLLGRYKKLKSYGVKAYIESPRCAVEKVMLLSGIYEIMPRI